MLKLGQNINKLEKLYIEETNPRTWNKFINLNVSLTMYRRKKFNLFCFAQGKESTDTQSKALQMQNLIPSICDKDNKLFIKTEGVNTAFKLFFQKLYKFIN